MNTLDIATPPTCLRERVHGNGDIESFWAVGERAAGDIMRALNGASHFRSVLDFGCGCGRVLPFMQAAMPDAQFHAVDIDEEAIRWVRIVHPDVQSYATPDMPPLPYADASFDLIYVVSVWTHLDEDRQIAWLAEMRRVLKPGGLLVASLHGERTASRVMPLEAWHQIMARGFAYAPVSIWRDVFPSWYGCAWHTPEYIERVWAKYLTVRAHFPGALNDDHDLVVCEKRRS